ncbi:hypothetical protein N825_28795 [Skermanella stibiiresistens SB22]|uniref:Uncharacterized protein n=1 Tax=Skermanella stibiiresistens SB22 TaxID=1385369 RepID=W9GR17_9PROT|nr:hypothetical protein [Skermanella stibiiresistens]EWY36345.1 hypothetical protein N825_28795 [Skermanella stibiiresistens SB22]
MLMDKTKPARMIFLKAQSFQNDDLAAFSRLFLHSVAIILVAM